LKRNCRRNKKEKPMKNRYVKCKNTTPKDFSKDAIVNKISKLIKSKQ